MRFAEGHGVPANLEEAARWYERASQLKGLAPAQFRYASLLEKGQGVRKDLAQARRLYLSAAIKGNGKAMHNLAVLYAEGIDGNRITTPPCNGSARPRSAVSPTANIISASCARADSGTAKSYPEAYKWFALSAAQGDKESARKRDDLAAHMDAAALAGAEAEVKNFVAEPQRNRRMSYPSRPAAGITPMARHRARGHSRPDHWHSAFSRLENGEQARTNALMRDRAPVHR